MKFEDFLLQQPCDQPKQQKRLELEQEVGKLQDELDAELKLNNVLTCALQQAPAPVLSCSCLVHKFIPFKVQMLLKELNVMEKDIVSLERQLDKLRLELYHEKQSQPSPLTRHRRRRQHYYKLSSRERRASVDSAIDVQSLPGLIYETPLRQRNGRTEACEPNKISEELVNCLISIFLHLNKSSTMSNNNNNSNNRGSSNASKHPLSCMNSKGLISKASLINSCKAPVLSFDNLSNIIVDPYGVLPDFNGLIRDIGEYKHFIQITRSSMDRGRVPDCFQAMGRLRALMHKLSNVDLTLLTYKQKLAFWINLYNACIMHAFLEHGLPSSHGKLLALMNKAAVNVGGIILNALAIEHFILRCPPSDTANGTADEKEVLLRHAYGLGYPEPNVTFALCRGSWSSPALRVYRADDVVDQLGRARVEYLEAAVGVTSKKKVLLPKLLQWHMRDFADDMESLVEWIYSQLPPHSGSLKKLMMECVIGETKSPLSRMVEIQSYDYEFRYLLHS